MKCFSIIKGNPSFCFALIIISLFLTSSAASACSVECRLTQALCTVCFQNCLGEFSYYNCSQELQGQSQQGSSNTTISIYSEPQCAHDCCSAELAYFGIQKFSECPDADQQSTIRIAVGVVVFVLLVSTVCVCCCNSKLREKMANWLCKDLLKSTSQVQS
jgi:hypothetical protein